MVVAVSIAITVADAVERLLLQWLRLLLLLWQRLLILWQMLRKHLLYCLLKNGPRKPDGPSIIGCNSLVACIVMPGNRWEKRVLLPLHLHLLPRKIKYWIRITLF